MQDFRRLVVWQKAQQLTANVHRATEHVSITRSPGLRSQLRRAASSIAANIAEGASYDGPTQFARYLQMAIGSASEVESHLDLASRRDSLPQEALAALASDTQSVRRMLIVLRRRVLLSPHPAPTPTQLKAQNPNP